MSDETHIEQSATGSQNVTQIGYMVTITAGPFLMGGDPKRDPDAQENEMPQITVTLPEYQIGKYPVTVEEYRAFVEMGGYKHDRWWTDVGWKWCGEENVEQPRSWTDEKWTGDPRLPVVGVSWYEAWAYTQWLTEIARASHDSPGDPALQFRLPTETEWEKAARGTDGRVYPWGDKFDKRKCNAKESGIGRTTPVEQFSPAGDSPYGCADMAGNVWEWCLTKYPCWSYAKGVETMDNRLTGDHRRVVRGGSWLLNRDWVRAACRSSWTPGYWYGALGFRVCCVRPPS